MNDLITIMGASKVHGTMDTYCRQLKQAEIETHVFNCSDMPNQNGGGNLRYRVQIFRRLAEQFSNYKKLIISDAFDVLFMGKKEYVLSKIPTDGLLHAAEKNCYPEECQSLQIPDRGPWRYANGGLVCGTPQSFLAWCDEAEKHPRYDPEVLDQRFLNELLAEESPLCRIDYKTEIFFCLYGGYDELDFTNGLPVNTKYCTFPSFIHSNGKWDASEMHCKLAKSLSGMDL